tara:strand:+ start:1283 stop:1522 length:240 start_codon:yes stop_codon:yes gene_type:complete
VSKLKNLRLDKRDAFDCANNDIIMGESQDLVQAYIKHHKKIIGSVPAEAEAEVKNFRYEDVVQDEPPFYNYDNWGRPIE